MRITDISLQAKNPNRVNISVDGKYRFSLDVFQVGELGIKRNNDYSEEQFTRWWVENRNQTKGSSLRKLRSELQSKGVASAVVDAALLASTRSDEDELKKIIAKKAKRYDDEQKLMQYLARQGFSYDDIKRALMPDQ